MNQEQILEVYHQGPEAGVSLVFGIVEAHEQRIQTMERHTGSMNLFTEIPYDEQQFQITHITHISV
ncbi:hypothetical protein [Bacillus cereus group sp. BfR-BA-01380]|uniref:hypothetical protein n=1 Tax=Bacillus cereus group sp. BfR-BA-01380 TaxID=2920324 RepID=UPI001F5889F2|nr:hypothetical protein [Bacillus cereus group sp. BfR-BA-01380]